MSELLLHEKIMIDGRLWVISDIIRALQSRYLRDERKYDKWGAIGKFLIVHEVLLKYNISGLELKFEDLINAAFPRTFHCNTTNEQLNMESVRAYHTHIRESLASQEMEPAIAERVALDESAEKFCTTVKHITELLELGLG